MGDEFENQDTQKVSPELGGDHRFWSVTNEPSEYPETAIFQLYQQVSQTRTGTTDAEIFGKIHDWSFTNFSIPAHVFAGISKEELLAWQQRHRISLSTGRIRPAAIDLERAHAWGHARMTAAANRLHTNVGPPSVEELRR